MKFTIAPGVLDPKSAEAPPRTTSIRSMLVSNRNRLSAFMKEVCMVGNTGIPSSMNMTYSTPRIPAHLDVLVDLAARALDPGEPRHVAQHLRRASGCGLLDVPRGERRDGHAGLQVLPRRLGSGDDQRLQVQGILAHPKIEGRLPMHYHLDRFRVGPEADHPDPDHVTAGGSVPQHIPPVRASVGAERKAVDVHLGAGDRLPSIVQHGAGDGAGLERVLRDQSREWSGNRQEAEGDRGNKGAARRWLYERWHELKWRR